MRIYVLHHNDSDGFGAAWAAHRYFKRDPKLNVTYIEMDYNDPVPELEPRSTIYMLDFAFKNIEVIKHLCENHKKVIIIDHHVTAKRNLEALKEAQEIKNLELNFDIDRSGAILTWEYFHRCKPPKLLEYVQDFDLWKFELKGTRELATYLFAIPQCFKEWGKLDRELHRTDMPFKRGQACLMYENKLIGAIIKNAHYNIDEDGNKIVAVNACSNWSSVGAKLLENFPEAKYSVVYHDCADGTKNFSLRSRGDFDVSEIAAKKGGGGHKAAAGYSIAPRLL